MVVAPQPHSTERLPDFALSTIAFGVIIAILYWGRVFFITLISAIILAFILEPLVSILVKVRIPRSIAAFVVISLAAFLLYLTGVAAWGQISGFSQEWPRISERLGAAVDEALQTIDDVETATAKVFTRRPKTSDNSPLAQHPGRRRTVRTPQTAASGTIPEVRIHEERNPITDYVYARLGTLYQYLLMASFVPFLVYFMLSWQEHLYRSFLHFFGAEARATASRSLRGIADLVRAFVVGNFLLGLLLAGASWLIFWFIHIPYAGLAGPISGFLSLIPYLGLPLALGVPVLVSLGGTSSVSQIALIVTSVAGLHLVALNLLYPKIVGARVHLNPLVVTFALMFWAFLWDAAGLVLAIPLTAGIKAVCDNVRVLRPYGRFLGD